MTLAFSDFDELKPNILLESFVCKFPLVDMDTMVWLDALIVLFNSTDSHFSLAVCIKVCFPCQKCISMGEVAAGSAQEGRLRMITYLSPSLPIELFEMLRDYLEEKLGLEASIIYESRWSGPPAERDPDPFQRNEADMGEIVR